MVGEGGVAHVEQLVVPAVRPPDDRHAVDVRPGRHLARAVGAAPRTSAPDGTRAGRTVAGRRCAARGRSTTMRRGRFRSTRLQQLGAVVDRPRHQLSPDPHPAVLRRHRAVDDAALVDGLRRQVHRVDDADRDAAVDGDPGVGRHRRALAGQFLGELGGVEHLGDPVASIAGVEQLGQRGDVGLAGRAVRDGRHRADTTDDHPADRGRFSRRRGERRERRSRRARGPSGRARRRRRMPRAAPTCASR